MLPPDFHAFWHGVRAELARVPLEWERLPGAGGATDTHTIDWLRFSSLGEMVVYGWLAAPKDLPPGPRRGFLWLPGYSHGNPRPGPECLYPETVTLGLNLHGHPPDAPYDHPSTHNVDYITQGIDSPQTYVYRGIVAHCLRALEVLAGQDDVDARRIIVGGMSQGGGLALIASGLSPSVRLCLADMPWLCSLDIALSLLDRAKYQRLKTTRYPDARGLIADYAEAHPERAAQVYATYRYFDPLSHAPDIRCPTQLTAGGRDPSCKPPTIQAVFDALTCEKDLMLLPQVGHEIVPAMHAMHLPWVQRV